MRVHLFALCWNEKIVLPYFFKHYKERFRDIQFTIFDNMSHDGSREIMKKHGAQIIDLDTGGENRMDIQMNIKNNCYKQSDAGWVIVCDVDEWIECNDDYIENTEATIIKPRGYQMVGMTYNLDKVRSGYYSSRFNKCILFNRHEIKEINYSPGCHVCDPEGNVRYNTEVIPLYHMKFFHPYYYVKRSMQLAKRVSQYNKDRQFSLHYTTNVLRSMNHYVKSVRKAEPVR